MNPFDLPGPAFLFFYSVLVLMALLIVYIIRASMEKGEPPRGFMDPYAIAYLRGGENEVIRIATISLIDRGLLLLRGNNLQTANSNAVNIVRHDVERTIIEKCLTEREAASLFDDLRLKSLCSRYQSPLEQQELLPTPQMKTKRLSIFFIAAVILLTIAATKIIKALLEGRHNILFLILLTLLSVFFVQRVTHPRVTERGNRFLKDLRTLLSGLKQRVVLGQVVRGGSTNEVALLAAVFGIAAVPESLIPNLKKLYPKAASDSSTFGCGSTSGSSSCGSSCGGGNGGGGCGGCGGD